jgi:4-hydroxy-2-oxoheptanedioate aldolase
MRSKEGRPPSAEATNQAMRHILETCRKHRVPAGLHCGSAEEALRRIEEGWQFLAIGSELKMMLTAAGDIMKKLGAGGPVGEMAKY